MSALTEAVITKTKAPATGQTFVRDDMTPGLALRITAGDARAFIWEGRCKGRPRRITIGKPPVMSLAAARTKALELAGAAARGEDLAAELAAERGEMTFGTLAHQYIERHAKAHKRSWEVEDARMLRDCLPAKEGVTFAEPGLVPKAWTHRRLSDISRDTVAQLHARLGTDNGRTAANRVLAMLSTMYNLAKVWGSYQGDNPTQGVKRFKETKRERFLAPAELKRMLAAIEAEPSLIWKSYFMLALLLGPRRSELLTARWADFDLRQQVWTIPQTKVGRSHMIPLTGAAIEILKALAAAQGDDATEWVFPSPTSASGHIEEPRKAWERIRLAAKVPDVRMHDLRRTLGSWMAANGHGLPIIGKILGHSRASTTAIYARLNLDPQREALEATTRKMLGQ